MTQTEKSSRKVISGVGWVNPLTHDYRIDQAAHAHVFADAVELVQGVDYTVSNIGVDAGYVITITNAGVWAPTEWVLDARPEIDQASNLSVGGQFGTAFEASIDKLTRRVQRVYDLARRGLKTSLGDAVGDNPYTLPAPAADKLLGWNAAGDDLENFDPTGIGIALVDNDTTMAADSAARVPSQHAAKTFATTVAAAAQAAAQAYTDVFKALFTTFAMTLVAAADYASAWLVLKVNGSLPTRTAIKAVVPQVGMSIWLTEAGRSGQFIWTLGDFSAQIAADTQEGVYLKANTVAASTGAWVRKTGVAWMLEWFGGAADGTTSNTAALNAVIALFGASGGAIDLMAGNYLFSTAPNTTTAPLRIQGAGKGITTVTCGFASGDLFSGNSFFKIFDLSVTASVARTSGAFIKGVGIRNHFADLYLEKYWRGIECPTGAILSISTVECRDGVNNSGGISVGDSLTGPYVEAVLSNIVMDAASTSPTFGIKLGYVDAVEILACDVIRHGIDLHIAPQAAKVASSIKAVGSYFDTATYGVLIEPAAGATVQFVQFVGCWTSGQSQHGIYAIPGSGAIKGLELIGHQACLNAAGTGVLIDTGVKDFRMSGGSVSANSNGILVAGGVSDFSIKGVRVGPSNNQAGNTNNGITINAGAGANYEISGNDLRGNGVLNLSNGASGVGRVKDNLGYNDTPAGAAITVGASPFTYTAGARPETVYIVGGTVSGVIQAGVTIANTTGTTVELEPNESFQTTYSSLPFMNTVKH